MKKSNVQYYLRYTALAGFFLLLIILYVFEFPYFSNTFEVQKMVIFAMILGAAFGAFLGYRYQYIAKDSVERFQVYTTFVVLSLIFMPLLVSLSNRLLSFQPIRQEQIEVFQVEARLSERFGVLKDDTVQPNSYYIFFIRDGNLERIKTDQVIFANKEKGDMIQLPIKKGLWGYEVVML